MTYLVYTRSRRRQPNHMAETPDQLAARLRALEQLSQNFGLLLQSQLNNNQGGEDQQGMMAKMISNLKPAIFVGREDPATLENWLRDMEKIFTTTGTPEN